MLAMNPRNISHEGKAITGKIALTTTKNAALAESQHSFVG
jgi:hypothetical protein